MAQALRHRHRWDADNALLTASFALDRQVLDLRCRKQPQHRVLTAGRTKISSLIGFVFLILLVLLQHFPPHSSIPLWKTANKKARTTIAYSDTWHRLTGAGTDREAANTYHPSPCLGYAMRFFSLSNNYFICSFLYVVFIRMLPIYCAAFPQPHNLRYVVQLPHTQLYLWYYTHIFLLCQFLECKKQA